MKLSPSPCSVYRMETRDPSDCYICGWDRLEHDHSQKCANCQEHIPGNEFKVVMADECSGNLWQENDYFCNRKCLREYLEVWGF